MSTDFFQLSRRIAVFLLLPVHVLPFYNADKVDAEYFVLRLSRRIMSVVMRFTFGGDVEHYTFGANAACIVYLSN